MRRDPSERPSPTEGGFSAIEVLIGASVMAVTLLAIVSMFPAAYGTAARSGKQTTALALAQQEIELLKNQSYASLMAGTTAESSIPGHTGYTRTTTIEDNIPMGGVKRVTVTVATPKSGKSIQLMTLIAK